MRKTQAQREEYLWMAITLIVGSALMLVFQNEVWCFLDWLMTTTENFYGALYG